MSPFHWISELALFYFYIKYRIGKSNKAADVLSHHLQTCNDDFSDSKYGKYKMVSFVILRDDVTEFVEGTKLAVDIK